MWQSWSLAQLSSIGSKSTKIVFDGIGKFQDHPLSCNYVKRRFGWFWHYQAHGQMTSFVTWPRCNVGHASVECPPSVHQHSMETQWACRSRGRISRSSSEIKVIGQRSRWPGQRTFSIDISNVTRYVLTRKLPRKQLRNTILAHALFLL